MQHVFRHSCLGKINGPKSWLNKTASPSSRLLQIAVFDGFAFCFSHRATTVHPIILALETATKQRRSMILWSFNCAQNNCTFDR
jgi:hypothetical protein